MNLHITKTELHSFLYDSRPNSKISSGSKMKLLKTFNLMHEIFTYTLRTPVISKDLTIGNAFNFMNTLGYHITRYLNQTLDVRSFFDAMVYRFGYTESCEVIIKQREKLMWDDSDSEALVALT